MVRPWEDVFHSLGPLFSSHRPNGHQSVNSGATNNIGLNYDSATQLTGTTGTSFNNTYVYDNAANRTSVTNNGSTTTATPNDLNQITALSGSASGTLTYDKNGNLLSDTSRGQTYSWDAENRLVGISYSGGSSVLTYDAMDNLVQITESTGSTKNFIRTSSQILEERNASNVIQAQFYGMGQTRSGSSYYYTRDQLGSVRDVTTSSGSTQVQYSYDPYGQVTASTTVGMQSDFQFAGYYFHAPSGLNLTTFRAYNPTLGRWINRDPIGENGGINLYGYVQNLPISFSDPLGLWTLVIHWKSATTGGDSGDAIAGAGGHGDLILLPDPGSSNVPYGYGGGRSNVNDIIISSKSVTVNKKGPGSVGNPKLQQIIATGSECSFNSAKKRLDDAAAKVRGMNLEPYNALPTANFPARNSNGVLWELINAAGYQPPSSTPVPAPGFGPLAPDPAMAIPRPGQYGY